MRIRRGFIRWPCLHGSMHLVTTTTVPLFHCPSVPPCRHVIRRPCHRVTITPCHLSHHSIDPPATNMPQPCYRETWCDTVTPLCHRATSVQPNAPPYHSATWCATVPPNPLLCHRVAVPPCRRLTDTTHRHTYVHSRTWLLSIRPPDTVWGNSTIWSVAKNSNDYFTML